MAKKVLNIAKFFGGLNNNADPRDIDISEFGNIQNLITTKLGSLSILGVYDLYSLSISDTISLTNGYGLNYFGLDRDATGAISDTYYLVIAGDTSGGKYYYIYDENGTKVETISAGSGISTFKPNSFTVDGGTRLYNSELSEYSNSVNKWFGYISYIYFDDGVNTSSYNDFAVENITIEKPVYNSSPSGNQVYCTDISSSTSSTTPVNDGDIRIELKETSTSATDGWAKNDIDAFYMTYLYLDGQESTPTWIYGDINPSASSSRVSGFSNWSATSGVQLQLNVLINPPIDNKRISGMRIYTDSGDRGHLYLLATVYFDNGIMKYDDDQNYTDNWSDNGVGGTITSATFDAKPTGDTYQSITGITKLNLTSNDTKVWYGANVIANRINYIANIRIQEPTDESVLSSSKNILYSDSIFKSYVNKFDTFDSNQRLDIVVNDGEDIIKLESYADRLLEFKNKTLYIINIAQNIEFLESVERFKGIEYPYHSCHTEFGIAWINRYGVYIYDGHKIIDLLFKKGIRRISIDYWNSIYNGSKSIISYDPYSKRIVILSDTTQNTVDGLVFDLNTFEPVYGSSLNTGDSGTSYAMSNAIVNYDNNIIIAKSVDGALKLYKYNISGTNSGSTDIIVETKDIEFDNIEIKKNIYKLLISWDFGGDSGTVNVSYKLNGTGSYTILDTVTNSFNGQIETIIEFNPILEDAYSLQLKLDGTVGSNFKINDISIVYRIKGVH